MSNSLEVDHQQTVCISKYCDSVSRDSLCLLSFTNEILDLHSRSLFTLKYVFATVLWVCCRSRFTPNVKGSLCLFTQHRINKFFTIHHVHSIVYVIIDKPQILHRVLWNMNQFLCIVNHIVVFCSSCQRLNWSRIFSTWILCIFFFSGLSLSILDKFFHFDDDLISLNIWNFMLFVYYLLLIIYSVLL